MKISCQREAREIVLFDATLWKGANGEGRLSESLIKFSDSLPSLLAIFANYTHLEWSKWKSVAST